jgi:hypothetical protein
LTGGTSYTFTVRATNSVGQGPASGSSNSITTTPIIGQAFGGGFFAGQISTAGNGVANFNLVVGPKSTAETATSVRWTFAATFVSGADSLIDGPTNTVNITNTGMDGAAKFCSDLVTGGFSDWYLPAKNEFEVCYFNLKPTTQSNNTDSGVNPNAVPARASPYTSGNPAQTSVAIFQAGGAEAFRAQNYWTSSQQSTDNAWGTVFYSGRQVYPGKTNTRYARAVRRVAV